MKRPFIKIWAYKDLPQQYDAYIDDKDDIDYVALIPKDFQNTYIGFLEAPYFGCCDVVSIPIDNGFELRVGYHA